MPKILKIKAIDEADSAPVEVDFDVAKQSSTIMNMLPDDEDDIDEGQEVPIGGIKAATLKKCVEWMTYHQSHPWAEPENAADLTDQQKELERLKLETLTAYDKTFYGVEGIRGDGSNLNKDFLFDTMIGANVLAAQDLLDTGCKCVALLLKGRSPEQIRTLFNITNDFSEAEEKQVRRENEWAEESE